MNFREWLVLEVDPNQEFIGEMGWDEVLPYLGRFINPAHRRLPEEHRKYVILPFNGSSLRVKVTKNMKYIIKHPVCAGCGVKGEVFKILRSPYYGPGTVPRLALFTKDGRQLTIDHILARPYNGDRSVKSDNIQTMCTRCNYEKDWKAPDEWEGPSREQSEEFVHFDPLGIDYGAPGVEVNGVKFIKPPRAGDDVVIMTDIDRFDADWSKDRNFYIPPGGGKNAIGNRYAKFSHFLSLGKPIVMPEASVWEGTSIPAFTNGRHRYCVLRDRGWREIPICVDSDSAPKFNKLYGV